MTDVTRTPAGGPQAAPLTDRHGREVSYLRLSVTDRCNLRCGYCVARQTVPLMPHDAILSYEELLDIIGLAGQLGIDKVRLTGGEPFVRRDFMHLVAGIRERYPAVDLRLTTNGTLLSGHADALKAAGMSCVNLSLDTLDRATFERITGRDALFDVRRAMDEVLAAGLSLKINAVAMRGVNDAELPAFIAMARNLPVDVRYIEFMPMGGCTVWNEEVFWPAEDILAKARELAELTPVKLPPDRHSGPAKMFTIAGGKGRFGLITPLSSHFCGSCNRLRITPDGRLRTCLFSDKEYRLRPILRHPRLGLEALARVLRLAGNRKPLGYEILKARTTAAVALKHMSAIGG